MEYRNIVVRSAEQKQKQNKEIENKSLFGGELNMISKEIIVQYADLQQEVKEVRDRIDKLEKQIEQIKNDGLVIDKVMGGDGGLQPFKIEGFPYPEYSRKKTLLYARKATLSGLEMELLETLNKVEEFIASIKDSHMRRIITLRVIDGLSWNKVADRIGGSNTEDSVKKAFYRFMEQK